MATASAPRINGVDPGHGTKNTASHGFKGLQGLLESVHTISKEDGFKVLTDFMERLNSQEANLKDRDGKIDELKTQLAANEASRDAWLEEQLNVFEKRYRKWAKEEESLQRGTESLTADSREKDKSIATLQGELKKTKVLVDDLQKAYDAESKSVKNKNVQIIDLEAQLKAAVRTENDLRARVKKADENAADLDKAWKKEAKEKEKLQSEAVEADKMIKEYKGFPVKLKTLELPAIKNELEGLWGSVAALVVGVVGCDLPDNVLGNDWTKLNDNELFKTRVPLPQNNSNIAKHMRVAVVLGAVARLVVPSLFQPTYVLEERRGLRNLLRYQATVDPRKEMYTRGILLSMSHNDQEEREQERIDYIIDDLNKVVRIDVLFATEDDLETFFEALEDLLVQFKELWKRIQRGTQKLEPSFDVQPSATKYPWYIVGLPAAGQTRERNSSPPTTTDAQEDTIIVPQIVQMRTKGGPEPITRGWVLQKAKIHAAEEEILRINRGLRTTPFVEETASRPRIRPRRAMSMSGNASSNQKKIGSFLPPGSAAHDA